MPGGKKNIIQADRGSTASINVYKMATLEPIAPEALRQAEQKLFQMSIDEVPEPASAPDGSCLALGHNKLFVGRQKDLKDLAGMLKGGATAAIGQIAAVTGLGGIGNSKESIR
jgi:hypothetical protein